MPSLPRILIAAAAKSSGKTTLTVGLARALRDRGLMVRAFKKGPDYIDPLWHRLASGRASYNLDFNTQSPEEILHLLAAKGAGADINIIETNKGLHDGIDLKGRDSNATLAKLTRSPVVLLIDTEGTTRGIAPLLLGYQAFDPDVAIAGVILNRVGGPRHEQKLRAAVETYTDIPVLGAVPRDPAMILPERHLGLTTPGDMETQLSAHVDRIARAVRDGVDLNRLLAIADGAPALEVDLPPVREPPAPDVRIAIARDAAFCFTYADDLEAFAAAGAELVPFSPITDERLPENIDGLFLPGGFPETHMAELAANERMRAAVRAAIEAGLPTYAECGGLMYLSEVIEWNGQQAPMCGVVRGRAVMHERPRGRGVIRLQATGHAPFAPVEQGATIAAHEFHYAALDMAQGQQARGDLFAWNIRRGHGIDGAHDGLVIKSCIAGFAHLRHTGQSPWVDAFVKFIRTRKRGQQQP